MGDALQFTIKDSDPAKPDDVLGKLTIPAAQFHESGFEGTLPLTSTGVKEEATLTFKVQLGEKPAEDPPPAADGPAAEPEQQPAEAPPAEDAPVLEETAVTSSCC